MNCPSCQAPVTPGAAFCDNCGMNLMQQAPSAGPAAVPSGTKCPGCGAENVPGSMYCDNCGAALNQAPAAPPQQAPQPGWPPQPEQPQPPQPGWPPQQPAWPPQGQQPQAPQQPAWPPQGQGQQPQGPQPGWGAPPSIPGRFVVQPSGASLPIPPGKTQITIGREDPVSGIFPDVDLETYDALNQGVSRSHARLTMQGGQVYVEDLNTANYTNLRGQRLQPGQKYALNNGDELVLGRLRLTYYAS